MNGTLPASPRARATLELVAALQASVTSALEALDGPFSRATWVRDEGRHGGGVRFGTTETAFFNRASVNVSAVHADDDPARPLRSATALSTIIHPAHPRLPSVHVHLSFTEWRDGRGGWRLMADLNPAIERPADTAAFSRALGAAAPELSADARARGDRYFFIPVLGRHRGATHFYVEDFSSGDFDADLALARRVGEAAFGAYLGFLRAGAEGAPTAEERARQLAYHSLYLFQVLTLDRGTTSGLLAHAQNDLGVMGSLPAFVDRALLESWLPRLTPPQDELLRALIAALPEGATSHVTDAVRVELARMVRAHYRAHPEALALQASGDAAAPVTRG